MAELRRIGVLLDASLRGEPRVVTLSGAAGSGKSALVSRLALDARRAGAVHVAGTCRPSLYRQPFGPWIEIIEGLRAARAIPDRRWHWLPRLVPSLAASQQTMRLVGDGDGPGAGAVHDEICQLLAAAAGARPLVVVIEDVEHADNASWEVIARAAAAFTSERILLCLTTDHVHADAARRRLAACPRRHDVHLAGLAPDDLHQWVVELFGSDATAAACAAYLAAGGAETPLRSVHALHAMVDDGRLAFAGGAWRAAPSFPSAGALPPSTSALLAWRIARLSPKTRVILGELALLGDRFEFDVALASGIGDEAELLDAIDEAAAAAMLREDGPEPGEAFAFTHAAVAGAARNALDARRMRRVHERIARALAQVRPVALFEIAEHFDRAHSVDRAFEYALLAAARALSVHAFADAAEACERAATHAGSPRQRERLDDLRRQLPPGRLRAGVA